MQTPLLLADTGLHVVDYLIVAVYLFAMLAVGYWFSRRQETTEDFFVGGRKMPWLATGLSMIATLMSTLSYLGSPGEIVQHGIAQATSLLALPFAFVIVGFVWVPFFMRLRLTSAYEYIDRRFGSGARLLAVAIYLWMRFLWMGAIIYTASLAVAQITQDTAPDALATLSFGLLRFTPQSWFYTVLLTTGFVTTLYTTLGGIRAVIWTDVAQFVVLFAGAILTIACVVAATGTGPTRWWHDVTAVHHQFPQWASWDITVRETVLWSFLSGLAWHCCTHASDQVALQRYFTTPDARAARKMAIVNYVFDVSMQVLLALVGMALLTYYLLHTEQLPPDVADPRAPGFADRLFPHFITYGLPIGISGLVVAAIFAVAQSSIDSGINSTTTVILVDLVRRYKKRRLDPHQELRWAQALTLIIGLWVTASGVAIALLAQDNNNIMDLQLKSFNCVLGPLGGIFMAGILLPYVGHRAVIAAGILGTASGFAFAFSGYFLERSVSPFLIIPLSWAITIGTAALLGVVLPRPQPEQVRGLTLASVLRGESPARTEGATSDRP